VCWVRSATHDPLPLQAAQVPQSVGFIEANFEQGEVFGTMDGKGVFLYATRGPRLISRQCLPPISSHCATSIF